MVSFEVIFSASQTRTATTRLPGGTVGYVCSKCCAKPYGRDMSLVFILPHNMTTLALCWMTAAKFALALSFFCCVSANSSAAISDCELKSV